jgi:DNA repair protein RecN (Recombination protein N)
VPPALHAYAAAYTAFAEANRELAAHTHATRLLNEKREMLEFQLNELKQSNLKRGEEEELENEITLLSSSAERIEAASAILEMLASSSPASIEKQVVAVRRRLEQLQKYDSSVGPWIDDVENSLRVFTELETFSSTYLSTTGEQADPNRIEKINGRLAKLQRLKKKYHTDIDGLIDKEKILGRDLAALENSEADHRELEKQVAYTRERCLDAGKELSLHRARAAKTFDRNITAMMENLGFKGGRWHTMFEAYDEPSEHGMESIRFFVRTNPGEAELPLSKTASGGEISRLMLAIKTVLSRSDYVPVLIFDEIDTGIGGLLAGAVGDALKSLSTSHQVLCISHLHQIASLADRQVRVYKEETGGRTLTRLSLLSEEERIREVARMLGGDSGIALDHARELLQRS